MGNNPNERLIPTTDFAEEIQRKTQLLVDKTKHNIMQSYLKYKEYYDKKAKASPLKENDYRYILQPKADPQGSKNPFTEFRWVGPYKVQKVLPNQNYIVRKINTNKTQILHRIRLRKFVPNTPIEDSYSDTQLQPDNEIIIPQDDLYSLAWEIDFGNTPFQSEQVQDDSQSANETEHTNESTNDQTDWSVHSSNGQTETTTLNNDVSTNNEPNTKQAGPSKVDQNYSDSNENASSKACEQNGNDVTTSLDRPAEPNSNTDPNESGKTDAISKNSGGDITVPGISERNDDLPNENSSPRGGKYNLRPNPNPNYSDEYRY